MSGRPRVAHVSSSNEKLLASLEQKRQSLAAIAAAVNNGSAAKKFDMKSFPNPVKRKKRNSESDEWLEPKDVESDESFTLTDEDDNPKRKRKPRSLDSVNSGSTTSDKITQSASKKERTLSESSEEGWLGKADDMVAQGRIMQTRVSQPKPRRKVITNFSDESDEGEKEAETLKDLAKNTQKAKRRSQNVSSDEEWGEDPEVDDFSDDRESTTDSDSDAESRRATKKESKKQKNCREFFNTASKEDLITNAKALEKVISVIEEKRPFTSYYELEQCLFETAHGKKALENYLEHVETRGILDRVLSDCKGHSNTVEKDFQRYTENPFQPSTISSGYNLHDYQKVGLGWLIMMYEKGFNCILGDEMGLGKTIQIVAFLAWLKENGIEGPNLIVVPSSTIENWMGEIHRWCSDLRLVTYYGSQDERKQIRKMVKKRKDGIDVILTTYNMIASRHDDKKFFKNFSLNYVIYDEGHMLKNCGTDRYKNLMKVRGKRKILLTGTPLQNNLVELISLMYFVMTKVFNKYCDNISQLLVQFKALAPGLDNSSTSMYHKDRIEQAKLILQPYILRRLKTQVLTLPPKSEEIVEVEMEIDQNENYENILEFYRGNSREEGAASAALMRLRQAANHPLLSRVQYDDATLSKIAKTLCSKEKQYAKKISKHVAEDLSFLGDFQIHQLCEKFRSTRKYLLDADLALRSGKCKELDARLPNIIAKKEKVLIFSQFTMMLDILEVYLKVRGHKFLRLDGSTPVLERQELINQFNVDEAIYIFLLSTKAGGLGINLTSANNIIIHDIDFNPYNDKQAEDRCHRMGQKKPVHVVRFISKGSIETGIFSLAQRKLQLEKQVTVGIKGQLEDDDEATRDSNDSEDNKPSEQDMRNLLTVAMDQKA